MFGAPLPIAIIMGLATFGITMATQPEAVEDSENSAHAAAQRLKQDKDTRT